MMKYFELMGRDQRFIQIFMNGDPSTFLTFSICNDYSSFANKDLWEYIPHNQNGKICFIEKLASLNWSREVFRKIEQAITELYPQVECAVWFRPKGDNERKVYYRRRYYEASLRN